MAVHLMPSEIARLVLGYLKESQCHETERHFLNESKHLAEYAMGLRQGINYSTNISGQSLLDIIREFCCLRQQKDNTVPADSHPKTAITSVVTTTRGNKSANDEMKRLSQQLTKIEGILYKLMQTMTANAVRQIPIGQPNNTYRIISTSSPMFLNAMSNAAPIVTTNQNHAITETPQKAIPSVMASTPSRSEAITPRRKGTPKRLANTPVRSASLHSTPNDMSDHTLVNESSSQLGDASEPLLKMDINEPLVQPEFIVGELLSYGPLHDVLAQNINKIFSNITNITNNTDNCDQSVANEATTSQKSGTDRNIDPQDIRINDEDVNNILASLESAPEFNNILDIITEKELQMTPYKDLSSVETNTSSASSLNTPQTPQNRLNSQKKRENPAHVVKNLMQELKTPEKTITLYASRSPSESARITPVKVTPVKVFRSDLIQQDFNYVMNDNNVPIIMPKVSVGGDDYNLIQSTLASNMSSYTVSSVPLQSTSNAIQQNRRTGGRKRVDFAKPASELQVLRSDLSQRKILPKPTLNNTLTTNIVPVYYNDNHKQPLLLVNNDNSISLQNNAKNSNQNETQTERRLAPKGHKRHNTSGDGPSAVKIKASDVHFPTVNILRKMNSSKMNQLLNKIHSNTDSN